MAHELLFDQWGTIQARIDELNTILVNPALDQRQRQELQKEYAHLNNALTKYRDAQAIVRELSGERIDIVPWSEEPEVFIARALSPAAVSRAQRARSAAVNVALTA